MSPEVEQALVDASNVVGRSATPPRLTTADLEDGDVVVIRDAVTGAPLAYMPFTSYREIVEKMPYPDPRSETDPLADFASARNKS